MPGTVGKGSTSTAVVGYRKNIGTGVGRILCEFLTPDSDDFACMVFYKALELMHDEDIRLSNWQICTYYTSAICALLPSMRYPCETALREHGVFFRTIRFPSQATANFMEVDYNFERARSVSLVHLGCALLVLFKNINGNSYEPFFTNRIKALCAKVGVPPDEDLPIPFRIGIAVKIRAALGFSHSVKQTLITDVLLPNVVSKTMFGAFCRYLVGVLAWSEMQIFCFIWNALIVTESPVMYVSDIRGEVMSARETFQAICESDYPQFFRYTVGPDQEYLLDRSRVRVLGAVAFEIMKDSTSGTLSNFVPTVGKAEQKLVSRLVDLHRQYLNRGGAYGIFESLSWFKGYDRPVGVTRTWTRTQAQTAEETNVNG